ncbi:MAG: EVE domain-containing protein [Dehalococcoidia bacterium]|nr:EVE domain-containing protein [Dehalococcoidia bacterium]
MAKYWVVVNGPEIFGKTRELGFTRHAFKSTRSKIVQRISPGDGLIFYVTGKKQLAGAVRVISPVVEDRTRVWQSKKKPEELYPFRVNTEPLVELDEERWLDAEPYHDQMQWTQKWPREHWTLAYQGNLREIPETDFEILLRDLRESGKTTVASK